MADTVFQSIFPALKAVDNGDGTYSIAVNVAGGSVVIFDDVPVDGEILKGITSNWAHDHAADLDAHTKNKYEEIKVGSWLSYNQYGPQGNLTMVQYKLYSCLIVVHRAMTFDQVGVDVKVPDAGKDIRLGCYNVTTGFVEGTLVQDFGTVDTDGVAMKTLAIAPSLSLSKGYYLLAGITDSNGVAAIGRRYGQTGGMGYTLGLVYANGGYEKVQAAGQFAALPDPFPGGGSGSITVPMFGLRVESID